MQIQPDFPNDRRRDPRRRAELEVHDQLAASDLPGRAIHEARAPAAGQEVDSARWFQGQGRFALQVKGGRYSLQEGDWHPHAERHAPWQQAVRNLKSRLVRGIQSHILHLGKLTFMLVRWGGAFSLNISITSAHFKFATSTRMTPRPRGSRLPGAGCRPWVMPPFPQPAHPAAPA